MAQVDNLFRRQSDGAVPIIDQDEIVPRPVHFREMQIHGRINSQLEKKPKEKKHPNFGQNLPVFPTAARALPVTSIRAAPDFSGKGARYTHGNIN
jgi:hypothetical protein